MEFNKLSSLYVLRSSSRTEIEDKVRPQNKIRSISSSSLNDKDTKEKQSKEIMIINNKLISNNRNFSSMSVHGGSITTISPDRHCIPQKNF